MTPRMPLLNASLEPAQALSPTPANPVAAGPRFCDAPFQPVAYQAASFALELRLRRYATRPRMMRAMSAMPQRKQLARTA